MELYTGETGGFLADYHLHSHFSIDGRESVSRICAQAMAMGMAEIAITDHIDLEPKCTYDRVFDFTDLAKEVAMAAQAYRGRLAVRLGAELGQPQVNPEQAERFYAECKPDFIIGSVHRTLTDGDAYLCDFASVDAVAYYARYLEELITLARDWDYDVLGHLTYPMRYMQMQLGRSIPLDSFTERLRVLFGIVIQRGKGIEVNASGYRQPIGCPYPPEEMLRLYLQCGGEVVTIGSDAHRTKDVGVGVREGAALLKEIGFRYVMTFTQRKPTAHLL